MPGGVASGFQHVTTNAPGEKRLYHIKGKRHIRTTLVEPKVQSMNKGDCFVLDSGSELFLYVGPDSKGVESHTARRVANQIRDQDHCGKVNITTIDSSSSEGEISEFLSVLGASSLTDVPDASTAGDDLEFEKKLDRVITLYKVSDEEGKMKTEKIGEKPLKQDLLDTKDCFILDGGNSGIFVWVGKKSNGKEKAEALNKGQAFINEKNYPSWTSLKRVVEGGEPTIFKEYFINWED
uniref:Gelsolin n=3 Tax=Lygus hesperus TaxID=30085 RepID=A0A0A9WEB4_LYGHE